LNFSDKWDKRRDVLIGIPRKQLLTMTGLLAGMSAVAGFMIAHIMFLYNTSC